MSGIKTNAGWWADGSVDDATFLNWNSISSLKIILSMFPLNLNQLTLIQSQLDLFQYVGGQW